MAMRLSFKPYVKDVLPLAVATSIRSTVIRHFTSNSVRAKDVASQENIPNLRHALRPCIYLYNPLDRIGD